MSSDAPSSIASVFVRIVWMVIGPAVLFLLALALLNEGGGWFSPKGIIYLAVLVSVVAARWIEFRLGHPQTAMGTPATSEHLRRYAILASLVGLTVWALVNLTSGTGPRALSSLSSASTCLELRNL